jgi:hypothetical protein
VAVSAFCLLAGSAVGAVERFEFTRMVAHWADYADPGYLSFIEETRPEVAQVGFYGAHFWSLADTPFSSLLPHVFIRFHYSHLSVANGSTLSARRANKWHAKTPPPSTAATLRETPLDLTLTRCLS